MNGPREDQPPDPESPPATASYLPFLEQWEHTSGPAPAPDAPSPAGAPDGAPGGRTERAKTSRRRPRRARRAAASTAGDALAPFLPPRRRTATELIKVRLAAEQLYWLRLTAARAGRKVSESTIVAAGLRVIEWLDLDWRCIDSRAALAAALSETLGAVAAPASGLAATEREWEAMQRQLGAMQPAAPTADPPPAASPTPAADEGRP